MARADALEPTLARASGWTGGQASLLRWVLGVALATEASVHWGGVLFVLGFGLGVLLAIGFQTRWVALAAAVVFTRYGETLEVWPFALQLPLEGAPAVPLLALALAWVAVWPAAPYGSVEAFGRGDPGGGWRLGRRFDVLWWGWSAFSLACALGVWRLRASHVDLFEQLRERSITSFAAEGFPSTPLDAFTTTIGVLALLVALAGPWRRTRRLAWLALAIQLVATFCASARLDLFWPWVWFLFALFDPAWVPARGGTLQVFYDGNCALCQGFTRFALAEDRGRHVEFGPQAGETYLALVGERAAEVPDSVVVRTHDDAILVRSAAVLRLLAALGGTWRALGWMLSVLPRRPLDWCYDRVARARKRFAPQPTGACPVVGAELQRRFLA